MKVLVLFLATSLLPGCTTAAKLESAVGEYVYLPRIVAIDGEAEYPDAFLRPSDSPDSLDQAVDALIGALPILESATQFTDVCSIASLDDADSNLQLCRENACSRLPSTSRDKGCGYLVRLADWVEQAWLGGLCRMKVDSRVSRLGDWFKARGINECHLMSTAVTISLAQALVGKRQDSASLLQALKTDSTTPN